MGENFNIPVGFLNGTGGTPTYKINHLSTFKIDEKDIYNPREKLITIRELEKNGGIWPQKMFMKFARQWLIMLDEDMNEIENFPGSMIIEPTALISSEPMEVFNNILVFTVRGVTLTDTEMHIFQVPDISAVELVQDLRDLREGKDITIDRNKTPVTIPTSQNRRDEYGIAQAAAEVAAGKNAHDKMVLSRDIRVVNSCFNDIFKFMARLQYAAAAIQELESRRDHHNPHGEGLLLVRSRPPTDNDFEDIFAKIKLALIYVVKLHNQFQNPSEPIHNLFISLNTFISKCNDVYEGNSIAENTVNPLLRRETINYLNSCLSESNKELLMSLGHNWTLPKDQFRDHKAAFHPIFFDGWSPEWIVDEEVAYIGPPIMNNPSPVNNNLDMNRNNIWYTRLQSRKTKIGEVQYSKVSNNNKELSVTKGEYLEILDDSRNWWKARNSMGNIGYVPHTIIVANNFDSQSNYAGRDTDSLSSSILLEHDQNLQRQSMAAYNGNREASSPSTMAQRAFSMPPTVPNPPPLPSPEDSEPTTPTGTLREKKTAETIAAIRSSRSDVPIDEALLLQSNVNDELRLIMQQRRRKDLEFMKTAECYINQNSAPKDVEEWLREKKFPENVVAKLRNLNGEELFSLSNHVIDGYFGQKEGRRLISQLVLMKNVCGYKTMRSNELKAKLLKARKKIETLDDDEVF